MTPSAMVLRVAGFACLYLAAQWAGRATLMDTAQLNLIWPAAGVAALWAATSPGARWLRVDLAALAATSAAANLATGAPVPVAVALAAAAVIQALVFVRSWDRLSPNRPAATGEPFAGLADLRSFVLAAAAAAACGAALGTGAVWLLTGSWSWPGAAVWLIRNVVSIVVVGSAGLSLYGAFRGRSAREAWPVVRDALGAGMRPLAERTALVVGSVAAYCAVFGTQGVPLAFSLMVFTVWAAMRCGIMFVTLHSLLVSTLVIVFTTRGRGPLAVLDTPVLHALTVQTFVGLVALVGLALSLARAERETLTRNATAARQEACEQARLLTTILDSMTEGVVVIDSRDQVVMGNSAAHRLLGAGHGPTIARDPGHYGLFHPDGRPLAVEELPHVRALAGEHVQEMDVLVRDPALPEALTVSVNATPIPDGDPRDHRAVVVLRDVTAERRHRDELAAFAGVVAHDLLNPLTTIDGWAEQVSDVATRHPGGHDITGGLARIRRAALRMRHLINDLLAYTTARDASLAPRDVRLHDLITEIVTARADTPDGDALSRPRFTLGDLQDVHADPVLLRQLVDNLISNALKYTRPGVAPHITVRSAHTAEGLVRVEICDNGIGIPPGQHEAIFGNFHRAHRTAGYTGTGLGLTICKRIVERHGGTITARDNPDDTHGACFVFTLPAASRVQGRAVAMSV
ncbi:sensor histidine kinase [Planobispora rosea]|uniref:sensor histidine kinase n=1 Tax=Planobispora rosea TaxID=35762 RepID=UPI00083B2330|nr:ATP-binding protein [Planobispora rosea]